jgi:hypothetical protein
MIHLDVYEWEGETFLRTWNTENPDTLMESVERPPRKQPPDVMQMRALRTPDLPELRDECWKNLAWLAIAAGCGVLVILSPYLVRN